MMDQERILGTDTVNRTDVTDQRIVEEPRQSIRWILEPLAICIMILGYAMIFQPFSIVLYSYSFTVMLVGTVMYIIASHLPE